MKEEDPIETLIPGILEALAKCHRCPLGANTQGGLNLAGQQAIHDTLNDIISVLFPGCHGKEAMSEDDLDATLQQRLLSLRAALKEQVRRAFEYQCLVDECEDCSDCAQRADAVATYLLASLPRIQEVLQKDIQAAYEGDPAAQSTMEVVMSYPGVSAIIVHRIAHLLYEKGVPLIPRIMSEHAHSATGIDIHPGACIGEGFFIDHGTGVVIGETCIIGNNVKLYQGVTLGALSFEKDERGNPVKGIKRHPNVGDNVVIYAGATILGGDTDIGEHSEVGGNVWLTHSVPPGSKVYNQQPNPLIRQRDGRWQVAEGPWADLGANI